MKSNLVERTTDRRTGSLRHKMAVRRVTVLGGTTTFADCLVALRYLADQRQLVQGSAIADYEQAFARQIGVRDLVRTCREDGSGAGVVGDVA